MNYLNIQYSCIVKRGITELKKIPFVVIVSFVLLSACNSEKKKNSSESINAAAKNIYENNWESLKTHKTPSWFTNGKFGIYFHWGVYSVPAYKTEWYPRLMYLDNFEGWGEDVRPHHIAKYGEDFQYHEFIPDFTAEHFNADEWASLFKKSGAQYAGPVAEHSDGFSMWNSKVNKWNAFNMGPKRDVVGELEKAIKAEGMKFVTTFHHQFHWGWYPSWNGLVDVSSKDLLDFYGEVVPEETFKQATKNAEKYGPSEAFNYKWKAKVLEVINNYNPDFVWFDSKLDIIPEKDRIELVQYFYNTSANNNKEVVLSYKGDDLPKDVGVLDIEAGRLNELVDYHWLTDTPFCHGNSAWSYVEGKESKGGNMNIDALIDIVSKNGCLLLNIGPKADGTIPEEIRTGLLEMGKWLEEHGEVVYGSKPFVTYGEGPTKLKKNRFGGFNDLKEGYCDEDFRFTTKDDNLYLIQLDVPKYEKTYVLRSFGSNEIAGDKKIESIQLMGSNQEVSWHQNEKGLHIVGVKEVPNKIAIVYKIKLTK